MDLNSRKPENTRLRELCEVFKQRYGYIPPATVRAAMLHWR